MRTSLAPDHGKPVAARRGNDELRGAPMRAESPAAGRRGALSPNHEEVTHVADPALGKEAPATAHLTPYGHAGASKATSTTHDNTEGALSLDSAGALDEQETAYMADPDLECPACEGLPSEPPHPCLVCANTGRIEMFGDEHALHRAGGVIVHIEDDMVAIRVPSYATHRAIGVDLPLATYRWLMHHGSLGLAFHDEDARTWSEA